MNNTINTEEIAIRAKQSQDLRTLVEGYRGKVERCDVNQDKFMNITTVTSEQAEGIALDLGLAGLEVRLETPNPNSSYCDGLYRVVARPLTLGGLTLPRNLLADA